MSRENGRPVGRPRGSVKGEPILEERIFVPILDWKGLSYKDYWKLYLDSNIELRAKQQRVDNENKLRFIPRSQVETTENNIKQHSFQNWFTRDGFKTHRLVNLLSLLKMKVVIVPENAQISLKIPRMKATEYANVKDGDVILYGIDDYAASLEPQRVAVKLPEAKLVLRKLRETKNPAVKEKE